MKKTLLFKAGRSSYVFLFVAAAMLFSGGCGDDSTHDSGPTVTKTLRAEPGKLQLDADGSAVQLTVTAQNVTWTAIPGDTWVHLSGVSADQSAVIEVSADPNTTDGMLTSNVVITADDETVAPVTIEVVQQPARQVGDDPIKLKLAEGYWVGDYWQTNGRLDDVYLIMTDMEISDGNPVGPGHMISLDMNIHAATFDTFDIVGTYGPSKSLVPERPYTFNSDEVSYVQTYDASGTRVAWRYATGGSVEIAREGEVYSIALTFTLDDQSTFEATYEGTIEFFDETRKCLSTLEADCTPSLTTAQGTFREYTGTEAPSKLLVLDLSGDRSQPSVDNVTLFLNVALETQKTGAIENVYQIIEDLSGSTMADLTPGTAIPGYLTQDESDQIVFAGSWYRRFARLDDQLQLGGMAPLVGGRITVTREDKVYTIAYSLTDDNYQTPHTVSGTYRGEIQFTNLSDPDPDPFDISAGGELGGWKPGGRW